MRCRVLVFFIQSIKTSCSVLFGPSIVFEVLVRARVCVLSFRVVFIIRQVASGKPGVCSFGVGAQGVEED